MDTLTNKSHKVNTLYKIGKNTKIRSISNTIKKPINFKLICDGKEFVNKLKGLPKIQRYDNGAYTYARKIFVNGNIKLNKVVCNKMNAEYYGALTLQEEAEEQEWTRKCYARI